MDDKLELEQELIDIELKIEDYEGQIYSLDISLNSLYEQRDEIIEKIRN